VPPSAPFRVVVSTLSQLDLDPRALCADVGLDPRLLDDDRPDLDLTQVGRVLARAEAVSGDRALGLHLAERASGRGLLAYVARAQPTVGDALQALERLAGAVWGPGAGVRIDRRGTLAVVRFRLGRALPRHLVEFVVARTVIGLRAGGAPACEVWFRHAPGGRRAEYERVLRCAPRFRQSETRIALSADALARPLATANPQVAAWVASALEQQRTPATTLGARLADAIDRALARGRAVSREGMARALGMSGRTLARRLRLEQRDFHDVLTEVRRALADRLVVDTALPLEAVAARVGFADCSAFGKAFRRWFGTTPSAHRRAAQRRWH